jgi:hypothetical protein
MFVFNNSFTFLVSITIRVDGVHFYTMSDPKRIQRRMASADKEREKLQSPQNSMKSTSS